MFSSFMWQTLILRFLLSLCHLSSYHYQVALICSVAKGGRCQGEMLVFFLPICHLSSSVYYTPFGSRGGQCPPLAESRGGQCPPWFLQGGANAPPWFSQGGPIFKSVTNLNIQRIYLVSIGYNKEIFVQFIITIKWNFIFVTKNMKI